MNPEEIKLLEKYEKHFETLTNSSWCPAVPMSDAEKLKEVYLKYSDDRLNVNLHCPSCLGNMMRTLYHLLKESRIEKEEVKEEIEIENEEVKETAESYYKPKYRKNKKSQN